MLVVEHLVKVYGKLAVPGILVMFTLAIVLTHGGATLMQERTQGVLRKLASAPISGVEVIGGKWRGRLVLATLQIAAALTVGTVLFSIDWGPNLSMVVLVPVARAGSCASAGLSLPSVARTEAQADDIRRQVAPKSPNPDLAH